MEWWVILVLYLSVLIILMYSGMPVAFAFMIINFTGIYLWMGSTVAFNIPISSALGILTSFSLLSLPFFILMGEILFHSGLARDTIDVIDSWVGRVPGRLGLVTVLTGGLFGALSGSALAAGALIGKNMIPEMRRKKWHDSLSIGCVLGSAGLALLIPPSTFAIIYGAIAKVSVAEMLMSILVPGIILLGVMMIYIVVVSIKRPELAPPDEVKEIPFKAKVKNLLKLIAPSIIVFLVTVSIYFGIATPTESAALGAAGSIIIAGLYGRLNWDILKKAFIATVEVTGMIMFLIAGSTAFSELLAITGATKGLVEYAVTLQVPPIVLMIIMQLVVFVLGFFIDEFSILMISVPVFMPIIVTMGWSPIWFGTITIIVLVTGLLTPPFGLLLFTIKGILPDISMRVIYRGAFPMVLLLIIVAVLTIIFPNIALWLPSRMQ